ncbi:hypothetical protein HPP92_001648 [Vanilla planifolia]|uniref:RRM domain-containing protein n=2 Tax=Vanilla planifolia TaxID=51239 RepID=A0A835VFJ4_VANPL|nr:hypothetical protein HPP92_001648 [Vanilla planifolia]
MERRGTKRGKPVAPSFLVKRLRFPANEGSEDLPDSGNQRSSAQQPHAVMVTGLPVDCTVLELKSRLEMYGSISRIRIDVNCVGYVTFRSDVAAQAAIAASLDPAFGIVIRSNKILVVRASDPLIHWRLGVGSFTSSRLVRAEKSLSKLGRTKKLIIPGTTTVTKNATELSCKEREIKTYDDLF